MEAIHPKLETSGSKSKLNVPAKKPEARSGGFRPPFDLFGMQTSFFINGEDKTLTWMGFISTIILASAVITVSMFQTYYYLKKKDPRVYINDLVLDGPPTIKLSNKSFVFMVKHVYPANGPLQGQQDKIFNIKFNQQFAFPDAVPIPYLPDRYSLPWAPCKDIQFNLEGVEHSPEDFENAICADMSEEKMFGGSYSKQETTSILDL